MKIGDNIVCKKSYIKDDDVHNVELYSKHNSYKIKDMTHTTVTIYFGGYRGWTTFAKNITPAIRLNHYDSHEWLQFYDYFYTNIEARKLKLYKIEGKL